MVVVNLVTYAVTTRNVTCLYDIITKPDFKFLTKMNYNRKTSGLTTRVMRVVFPSFAQKADFDNHFFSAKINMNEII